MVDSLIAESYSVNGNLIIDAINIVTGSATDTASVQVTTNEELKGKYKISDDFLNNMTGVEVYDNASYDDTTGVLTLEGKTTLATLNQRVKTLEEGGSGAMGQKVGSWTATASSGYNSNLVEFDVENADTTSVGANLVLLDQAINANKAAIDGKTSLSTVQDYLNNNYYTLVIKSCFF